MRSCQLSCIFCSGWPIFALFALQLNFATLARADLYLPPNNGNGHAKVHSDKKCINRFALKDEWIYLSLISVNQKDFDRDFVYRIESETNDIDAEIFTSVKWTQVNRPTLRAKQKTQFRIKEVPVYELLLDKNSLPLEGEWTNQKYDPPEYKVSGNVVHLRGVGSGKTNPVFVRLKIGERVSNDPHTITITENAQPSLTLCLVVLEDVLSDDQDRVRGIYYRGVTQRNSVEKIDEAHLKSDFEFIRSYGFNAITIYNSGVEESLKYGRHAKGAGLGKAIVMQVPHRKISQYVSNSLASNWILEDNVYLMGVDEPNSPERLLRHSKVTKAIHEHGGKVFTAMNFESLSKQPNSMKTDFVNFHIRSLRSEKYFSLVPDDVVSTYYWQSYLERPALNRLRSGVLLYWSELDGIFPYVYSHFLKNALPYSNDWVVNIDEPGVKRKQYLSVYPSAAGRISTYQWEAMRQGYDDIRALDLLDNILANSQLNEKRVIEIKSEMNQMIARIVKNYGFRFYEDPELYNDALGGDLETLRGWVKEKIVELSK